MRSKRTQRGLTLIEILIVLAVMGLMVAMLVVGFGAGRSAEISRTTNQIANTVRYGFDKARVNGQYFRMVLNLDSGTFSLQAAEEAMYLPATDRDGKIREIDQRDLEDQAQRDQRAEQSFNRSVQSAAYKAGATGGSARGGDNRGGDNRGADNRGGDKGGGDKGGADKGGGDKGGADHRGGDKGGADQDGEPKVYKPQPRKVPRRKPPLFSSFEDENSLSGLAKPFKLPEGVKIVYVRTADDLAPITKGEASIYFFPRGRTQKAHIQIAGKDGKDEYTIKIEPLTGRVTVVAGLEPLVLPDDPNDEEDELGREFQRRTF